LRTILENAFEQLRTPLGFWLGAVLLVAAVLLGYAAALGFQGVCLALRLHMESLHDLLRAARRVLLGGLLLVFAGWCLCTAWLCLSPAPYREWLRDPVSGVLPAAFHAAGLGLWVVVALLLVRRGVLLALRRPSDAEAGR
jgi:hypothetical protein